MRIFLEDGKTPGEIAGSRSTLRALQAAEVPNASITLMPHGNYSDHVMLQAANRHIKTLPTNSYVIRADADEHFTYPCDMVARLQQHDLWCADMLDRMAADGKVRPLEPLPEIAQQFPAMCWMRQHLHSRGGADVQTAKVVIMRVASRVSGKVRSFKTSHRLHDQYGKHGRCRGLGYFAHYTLTRDSLNFTVGKKGTAYRSNKFQNVDYRRMAAFMRQHLPGTPHDAHNHSYCQPPQNVTTMKAFHIHGWMEPLDRAEALAVAKATVDAGEARAAAARVAAAPAAAAPAATPAAPATRQQAAQTSPIGSSSHYMVNASTTVVATPTTAATPSLVDVDGCQHVYLDLGANRGSNLLQLYNPSSRSRPPSSSSLHGAFDRFFGSSARERQRSVCAIAIEPNGHHAEHLRAMERQHRAAGWRTTFLPRAASDVDGQSVSFFFDQSRRGRAHAEWGASLFSTKDNRGRASAAGKRGDDAMENASAPTLTLDVAALVQRSVLPRRLPPARREGQAQEEHRPPAVVVKMDIEGAEFAVLARLLSLGILCKLDYVGVEFHDEAKFLSLLTAAQAPRNFARVLHYVRAHAGAECKVELVNMGLRGNAR